MTRQSVAYVTASRLQRTIGNSPVIKPSPDENLSCPRLKTSGRFVYGVVNRNDPRGWANDAQRTFCNRKQPPENDRLVTPQIQQCGSHLARLADDGRLRRWAANPAPRCAASTPGADTDFRCTISRQLIPQ